MQCVKNEPILSKYYPTDYEFIEMPQRTREEMNSDSNRHKISEDEDDSCLESFHNLKQSAVLSKWEDFDLSEEEYKKIQSNTLFETASYVDNVGNEIFIHGKSNDMRQNTNDIELNLDLSDNLNQMQVAECDMTNNSSKDNATSHLNLRQTVLAKGLKCVSNIDPVSEEFEKRKATQTIVENRNISEGIIWAFPKGATPKKKRKRKNKKKLLNC